MHPRLCSRGIVSLDRIFGFHTYKMCTNPKKEKKKGIYSVSQK